MVQLDPVGADHPVGFPAGAVSAQAGGVGSAVDHSVVAVEELHPVCVTMALGGQELVGGVVEIALESIDLHLQGRALVDVAGAVDVDVALGMHGVVGQGVFHPIGADHGVGAAQFGTAFQHGVDVRLARDLFGPDVRGQLAAQRGVHGFLQLGAGLELWGGQGTVPQAVPGLALRVGGPGGRGSPDQRQGRGQRAQTVGQGLRCQGGGVGAHRRL